MLQKFDKWHKTRQGLLTFSVIELLLSYIVASLAIDNGSLLFWLIAIVLFAGAVQNFVKFVVASWKKN